MVVDGEEEGFLEKVSEHAFYMSRIKCRVPDKCHWKKLALSMPSREILVLSIIDLGITRKNLDDGQAPERI